MFMLKSVRRFLTVTAVTLSLGALAGNAMADTQWQKDHPRREQVNNRLANQNKRIKQERKEGEITKAQAQKLHSEDHAIRQEERTMASTNGGHITKAEQKALNQQENQVSKQIGK
jgi:ABC-type siderophore export system fused ATPase/permease subunit